MNDKTHYRKAFDSPYLSSADIVEPTVLTVREVRLEGDKTKKTKDQFNTAYFIEKEIRPGEKLKPMILNATNSKTMKALTDSAFIDDWQNIRITVYVDHAVRFGKEMTEGLRISPERPRDRPAIPPALMEEARLAASMGAAPYAAFWTNTGKGNRKLLAAHHDGFKADALRADSAPAPNAEPIGAEQQEHMDASA